MCEGYTELTKRVVVWELGNDEPTTKLNKLATRNALYTVAYDMKNAISRVGYMDYITGDREAMKELYSSKHFDCIALMKKNASVIEICEVEGNTFKIRGTNFYFRYKPDITEQIDINRYALVTFWCGCYLIDLKNTDEMPICISDTLHIKLLTRYLNKNGKMIIFTV